MKMGKILILILLMSIALVAFFYPKRVGGVLCGPVCSKFGLHTWKKDCLGIRTRSKWVDAYTDYCFGIPINERECYGVPYSNSYDSEDVRIDCNYPCNKDTFKNKCNTQEELVFKKKEGNFTVNCDSFEKRCDW